MRMTNYIQFQYNTFKLYCRLSKVIPIGSFKTEDQAKAVRSKLEAIKTEYEEKHRQLLEEIWDKIELIKKENKVKR